MRTMNQKPECIKPSFNLCIYFHIIYIYIYNSLFSFQFSRQLFKKQKTKEKRETVVKRDRERQAGSEGHKNKTNEYKQLLTFCSVNNIVLFMNILSSYTKIKP